jgi:hypothetical protein
MTLKNSVTPPRIDPGTVRLEVQRLTHYATPGAVYIVVTQINVILEKSVMSARMSYVFLWSRYESWGVFVQRLRRKMKWQFPIVFWEFVKQSRADCWTSFSPYRLRTGQTGTRVCMRFPSGKVWKRGCRVTIVTKHRLLSYPYLKIYIVMFFSLLASFFSYSFYHREQLWIFRATHFLVFFHQELFSFGIILDK